MDRPIQDRKSTGERHIVHVGLNENQNKIWLLNFIYFSHASFRLSGLTELNLVVVRIIYWRIQPLMLGGGKGKARSLRPEDRSPKAGVGFLVRGSQPSPHQLRVWGAL